MNEIESMESIGKQDTKQVEAYINALDFEKLRITQGIQVTSVKSYLNGEYIGIYPVYVTWNELYLGIFTKALFQASLSISGFDPIRRYEEYVLVF